MFKKEWLSASGKEKERLVFFVILISLLLKNFKIIGGFKPLIIKFVHFIGVAIYKEASMSISTLYTCCGSLVLWQLQGKQILIFSQFFCFF